MSVVFWIVVIAVIVAGISGGRKKNTVSKGPVCIDRPHVIDPDDYECSVCHRRFRKEQMVCPYCGASFSARVTDDEEFIDEEDELEAWDEEDGM